jgi:NAD(P)-dependent dehydrogenase (short-subunit alcohol dehydrogenase family)
VRDDAAVRAAVAEAVRAFGRLDAVANAAGVYMTGARAEDVTDADWERTLSINLAGTFKVCRAAFSELRKAGGGAIVNIASVNARRAAPGQGIYSMTKAGIVNMTEGLAKELAGHGIRVNAILPGLTETKFASAITSNPKLMDMMLRQIPLGRTAQPHEIAPAALFLLSPAAGYISGTTLAVDGGYLA